MESLDEKLGRYEKSPLRTWQMINRIKSPDDNRALYATLCHGIRNSSLDTIESIFITGGISPSNQVASSFIGMDGETHYLFFHGDDIENCNRGEFVSLMPSIYSDDYCMSSSDGQTALAGFAFRTFVNSNIYFTVNGFHEAFRTKYLTYDEYEQLILSKKKVKNCYSYAPQEYFSPSTITLDEIMSINIDSKYFSKKDSLDTLINGVIALMKHYDIKVPFYLDNQVIYQKENKEEKSIK